MEKYYNEIYVYGPNPRIPISSATIAGAAAFKVNSLVFFLSSFYISIICLLIYFFFGKNFLPQLSLSHQWPIKAVQQHDSRSSSPVSFNSDNLQHDNLYFHEVNKIREAAAQEVLHLLQMFPIPNIDPAIIMISAEAGAHRLYDRYNID